MFLFHSLGKLIRLNLRLKFGFTLMEIMVTIAILSVGIVFVFKALLFSLDQINYLTTRLYATTILDNRVSEIERRLRIEQTLPFDLNHPQIAKIGKREVTLKEEMNINTVEDYPDVFKLDLSLSWQQGQRSIKLSRSAYILDYAHLKK